MKRILISLLSIGVVAIVAVFATQSFFSDTETSLGNRFVAGDIDLQIDNESYAIDHNIPGYQNPVGAFVASTHTSWDLVDLTIEKFFDFVDLKPGDYGEDTISVHVGSNDAWMCAAAQLTEDQDNSCTDPENADDPTCQDPDGDGELDEDLNFAFWVDDGDNVFEVGEEVFLGGPLSGLEEEGQIALADSESSILGGDPTTPIPGGTTFYIGKIWCFGELSPNPVQLGVGSPISGNPARGTGWNCNGALVDNAAQTDSVVGDLEFFAVQSRNNPGFTCDGDWTPEFIGQRPHVGAALGEFVVETSCDATVDTDVVIGGTNFHTIQAAINDAGTVNGETVCVDDGTYPEDVVIDKEIRLSGDGATATSTINGQAGGQGAAVKIAANNVTLEGFDINGAGIAALWLNTGVSGATVRYNKVTSAAGGVTAVTTQGSQSNHLFSHNEFVGNGSGQIVYVNGDVSLVGFPSDNVDFDSNTFSGTIVAGGVALGSESTNSEVTKNIFESTLTSTYALYESWKDDALVNFNNFYDTLDVVVKDSDPGAGPLNAEDNWWGEAVPAGHLAGDVDDDPKEAAAFPEN